MSWMDPEIAGYVATESGRLWYRVNGTGQGGAPIVGITGGPGMSHHYLMPLLRFADRRPVVLYDQIDTGNSDRPGDPANWTVPRFVEEIESLRKALGADRILPAGHSWGGLLAYEYALRYPGRTAALLLLSPCLSAARWRQDAEVLIAGLPDYVQRLIAEGEASGDFASPGYQHANDVFKARHLRRKGDRPPELMRSQDLFNEALYNHVWGPSEFTARGTLRDYDGTSRLGEYGGPVLFVCGEHDEAREETMQAFAARMRNARVAVVPGVAHLSMNEDPAAFHAAVAPFLSAETG